MTCQGAEHVFTHMGERHPLNGSACACGAFIWLDDGAEATMPSGICPRCHKPWDDHTQGACPKVTA